MLKMVDVLEQTIVQSFAHSLCGSNEQITEQLNQSILNAADADLKAAIIHFFEKIDIHEAAQALEIPVERIATLQQGIQLKDEQYLADTLKIVALGLAMETNSLDKFEISDSLQDYPM